VIAEIAKSEVGALTVGVITKPFSFEGAQRKRSAEEGIARMREVCDTVIVIPNDLLLESVERRTTIVDAFASADNVLRQGVQGITDLITIPGLINLDFADVRTIMQDAGSALMGIGQAAGESRAADAANAAISSPLLEESIDGATGILLNITAGSELGLFEVNEAAEIVHSAADPNATIIFGAVIDDTLGDEVRVTVIATGFEHELRRQLPRGGAVGGRERPAMREPARDGREARPSRSREGGYGRSETGLREPRDRRPTIDSSTRSSLEISDDDIDIPPFLK
jgi:cell division protein FtsZ